MEIVKYAWVQAGFIGLLVVLAGGVMFVGWRIIQTLWKTLNELRLKRDEDFQKIVSIAELSKIAMEKNATSLKENNDLLKILISSAAHSSNK